MSARGKCQPCALALMELSATQISEHAGPFFQHWRRRTVAAFGGVLLDDLRGDN